MPSGWLSSPFDIEVQPPKPTITQPVSPVEQSQVISGTELYSGASLKILDSANQPVLGTFTPNGAAWTFTPNPAWVPGDRTIKAVQTVGGVDSDPSDPRSFKVKPPKPVMDNPVIVWTPRPTLTGTGHVDATVKLYKQNVSSVILATATVGKDNRWEAPLTQDLAMADPFVISGLQEMNGVTSDWAEDVEFAVLFKPVICTVTVSVEGKPTVDGTGGLTGASVEVWLGDSYGGVGGAQFSTIVGPNGIWSGSPDIAWSPRSYSITAKQVGIVTEQESDWAIGYEFEIQAPKPTIIQPPDPATAKQELTITGVYTMDTVILEMLTQADTQVPGDFSGTGASRIFTPAADWAPGPNTVKVLQTVEHVPSDPSDLCTFTVEEGDKPEAPQFDLPLALSSTSTRPAIKVTGLAHAQVTVRLEGSAEELHSAPADAQGVLEFSVETPLTPGMITLEVKQKGNGAVSDWSEPHPFTVKELPKKPEIDAPTHGSSTQRKPVIRGKGETRGQILLRHEDDPENLIATIDGVKSWRWTAKESWDVGTYTIQVKQTDDGDSSEWTAPRTFDVVESIYGIGDAGPVLGQPAVDKEQRVLLRVQVISGDTGEVAAGVKVEWRLNGEQDVIATTETDPLGWTRYPFVPDSAGKHEVVADITHANQGVVMTQLFEVTALSHEAWAQEAELYLDDQLVDLAKGDLVLFSGESYALELRVNSGSPLIGSSVTLQDLWGAAELGLDMVPEPGVPQRVEAGEPVCWSISFDSQDSGFFGLNLTSPVLPDWQLPGRVEVDFAKEVSVVFANNPKVFTFGGHAAHPCLGASHIVTVRPKAHSLLLGKRVTLELSDEAAGLGVEVHNYGVPAGYQTMVDGGVSYILSCTQCVNSGNFSVRLRVIEWDIRSLELPMYLGHNKVEVMATAGPEQSGGAGGHWIYGALAVSAFSSLHASGVPVTVSVSGVSRQDVTGPDGWVRVEYEDGQSAHFEFHNLFDGSSVSRP
ncbi:hypothetical protein PS639_06199 [Pseudomonas fluorescens]|nr:hypothetical protein PS639_06199 [Pseudomonas fluorescens]